MSKARARARRSGYGAQSRLTRAVPALAAVAVIAVLLVASYLAVRTVGFLHGLLSFSDPVTLVQKEIDPPPGSVAYKLRHGQRVNLLVLGYGGDENDAPYLTDSLMVVSLDPASRRVLEASIPRDLYVRIDPWQDGRSFDHKINVAFEIPLRPEAYPGPLKPEYQGRHGPGHLSEAMVGRVTGLSFDRYIGMDFKAFRDVVDALGGVEVHMDAPLDDCHFPDYHDGYVNRGVPLGEPCPAGAGIHFRAGDYRVSGEQALQIARSRDAEQREQATDFARSRRQQMLLAAIRRQGVGVNAIARAPQLMDALEKNVRTDLDLNDLKALYDFAGRINDSSYIRIALTATDLLDEYVPGQAGSCGHVDAYALCPEDRSFEMARSVFRRAIVDRSVLAERAPVRLIQAAAPPDDLDDRVTNTLRPLGFQLAEPPPSGLPAQPGSVVYDGTGGRYPLTAAWMADFFGAQRVAGRAPGALEQAPPGSGQDGLVVVIGDDFAGRWRGRP